MTEDAERLFERAGLMPRDERSAFLDEACADDPALRAELASLLQHADDAERFFDRLGGAVRAAVPALDAEAVRKEVGEDLSDVSWPAAAAAERDAMVGRTIGRYRVLALLGRGGMGAVYRAHDERLARDVALKFLPSHLAADPRAARRFLTEARAAASLAHPNVCTVHEIGETDDRRPFIAMTLYEGETLRERLRRGPLPPCEAAAIARELASALRVAHAAGIVHRDVKPGNVMLARDGICRLLDFGLAQVGDARSTGGAATPGTLAYMSPEQVAGDAVDHRSDLWSLGVVLHEMLAGARPFHGDSAPAVMQAILHDAARPLAPQVPPALGRIVEHLLRKAPRERYADAAAVEEDLGAALSSAGSSAAPAPVAPARRSARRRLAAVAGVALVAAVAAALGGGPWAARSRAAALDGGRSLVVLPFVDTSADSSAVYFSDGLTEEVITRLAEVPELKVISRTSAMRYRGSRMAARAIASELGVAHVVQGSVRHGGGRVRVTAQLIDARTDVHRWTESYDVEAREVVQVQERIAREVVRALRVELGDSGEQRIARRGTLDPEAYDHYRRGRYFWNLRSPEGHARAVAHYRQAIARDSGYADAYAGLADAYLTDYQHSISGRSEAEAYAGHKWAAERALALDDASVDARVAFAVSLWWRRDWPGAERELRRALDANPGDARARDWYSLLLAGMGRLDEAMRESRRAVELDPFAANFADDLAWHLYLARDYGRAVQQVREVLEIHPTYPNAHRTLGMNLSAQGMHAEAIRAMRQAVAIAPARREYLGDLAYALARSGAPREARAVLREAAARPMEAGNIARAWVALGEADSAFAWLERASWQWPHRAVRADPAFDPIRDDPRFLRLSERIDREMGVK